jgi:hypothetical protein
MEVAAVAAARVEREVTQRQILRELLTQVAHIRCSVEAPVALG